MSKDRPCVRYICLLSRADDIADGDWEDRFPGANGELDQEAMLYREKLEELQNKDTVLDHEHYLEKITQLFFFRKKLSTCYSEVSSTDPVFFGPEGRCQEVFDS